jgi:endoglucanase Acf2
MWIKQVNTDNVPVIVRQSASTIKNDDYFAKFISRHKWK